MPTEPRSPLLTSTEVGQLLDARAAGRASLECSLDLKLSMTTVQIGAAAWTFEGRRFPYPERCRERTVYHWSEGGFEPVARFASSLVKLVPTEWGPPTFEIDGIKMLPTAKRSPFADAAAKVALIQPQGKRILDTCGGLGYFAAWCLRGEARHVLSYEINPDVRWLRELNPWSPPADIRLMLIEEDVSRALGTLVAGSMDAVLHDPPRFGTAGNLYSLSFYQQLARALAPRGRLFHYTGSPNKLTSGRDVPREVAGRLQNAGFVVRKIADGLLAVKT
jgi:predicted methyltransferase